MASAGPSAVEMWVPSGMRRVSMRVEPSASMIGREASCLLAIVLSFMPWPGSRRPRRRESSCWQSLRSAGRRQPSCASGRERRARQWR
jgi:hypothetical protein